ncbi:D-alanyl-D-alanine carboxypeptidase/D-alanyl-D-alanine-endopeptidase [bacterium]|nr:D-alanyl-D-alanine carboxypeptidase/D-alanyl-D-alanine-endopeptidase [bacterium]
MHRRLQLSAILLGIAVAASTGSAAPSSRPSGLSRAQLVAGLRRLTASPPLKGARVGVAVVDLVDGATLFEHGADLSCSVASNNKLVTTAAALELLGARFAFRTSVYATGNLRADGLLEGDLLVVGRGDPSISGRFENGNPTAVFERWATAVAASGIRRVRGSIIADDTYLDRQFHHPDWPKNQLAAWYCAPTSALSFNDNCIRIIVRPGPKRGAPAIVTTEPRTTFGHITNRAVTGRARVAGKPLIVHRRPGTNNIVVSGSIPEAGAVSLTWLTVHEPALYTATVFRDTLAARGVVVGAPPRLLTPSLRIPTDRRWEVITTESLLAQAVAVTNSRSQNFYAEQFLKTLGKEKAGEGSFAAGARVVADFLRTAGVAGAFTTSDGSGLARGNRYTARQLVTLLAYMNGRRTGGVYLRSLARPGADGTLAKRLLPLKGKLHAKTGYIAGASALSGYVETRGGRLLAFSILVNSFRSGLGHVKAFQDKTCLTLAEYKP